MKNEEEKLNNLAKIIYYNYSSELGHSANIKSVIEYYIKSLLNFFENEKKIYNGFQSQNQEFLKEQEVISYLNFKNNLFKNKNIKEFMIIKKGDLPLKYDICFLALIDTYNYCITSINYVDDYENDNFYINMCSNIYQDIELHNILSK